MSAPTNIVIQVPSSGGGETVRISVTVVNGQFYFDGQLQTDYELIAGNTYIFEQSPANGGDHVLGISNTSGGSPLAGLTYFYNGTQTSASTYDLYLVTYGAYFLTSQFEISYTVPEDGPGTLYFFSTSSDVTGELLQLVPALLSHHLHPYLLIQMQLLLMKMNLVQQLEV